MVRKGVSPKLERDEAKDHQAASDSNTFRVLAEEWMHKNAKHWTTLYADQVERTMKYDLFPKIGARPIRRVSAADILDAMERIEARGAPTIAILARQWSSAVFRHAITKQKADVDPSVALRGAIKAAKVRHHPPLSKTELPKFLEKLGQSGGYRRTVIAQRLLLILFVRTVELRRAEWAEFDLKAAQWRIPASRMKKREEHLVPLPKQAVVLLEELRGLTGNHQHLFPNHRKPRECMSATTLNAKPQSDATKRRGDQQLA